MTITDLKNFIDAAETLANQYNYDLSASAVTFGPDALTVAFIDGSCNVEITYSQTEKPND